MRFINKSNNTVRLDEIRKNIPYLQDQEQYISADEIKKSPFFQRLCLEEKIKITGDCNERIEQNLLKLQQGFKMPKVPSPIEVSIKGHFYSNTGYSKANRNLLVGLLRAGCAASIDPVNQNVDGLNELEAQQLDLLCRTPSDDAIVIHSSIPSFAEPTNARYSILNTTIEATTVPTEFVTACDSYDEVWTTSDFCKNVLQSAGVKKPIFVIPNAVNTGLYSANVKPYTFTPKLKEFAFVSIFGWNYRKGYDALIRAYLEAFNGQDNVSLLIVSKYDYDKSGKCQIEQEIQDLVKRYGGSNPAHIARHGRTIMEFEMPRLYRACQSFVLPSRGEGFGLPYMESALCGLPVIATNYSGHTMFLDKENSNLVDIDQISRIKNKMDIHYWDGEMFPELTSDKFISSLAGTMRDVYSNYPAALQKNDALKRQILANYTIDKIGSIARERLDVIWNRLG